MRYVERTEHGFYLRFDYNPWLMKAIQVIPGCGYTGRKGFFAPLDQEKAVLQFAHKHGFTYMDGTDPFEGQPVEDIVPMRDLQQPIALKQELYPFQRQGVQYMLDHPKCICGDKPGLGKTAQAIAAIVAAKAFPCLIICPASLKYNWKAEIEEKWAPSYKAEILSDQTVDTWPLLHQCGMADFYITNYESLKKYFVAAIDADRRDRFRLKHVRFRKEIDIFQSLVVDEAHRCKDTSTQQTKFVRGLSIGKKYVLLLTGTPVVNKPNDLIALLGIIEKVGSRERPFGPVSEFEQRYCISDKHWNRLNAKLRNECYYSREKKDVLTELPEKSRQVVLCDITTGLEYRDASQHLAKYLKQYRQCTDQQIAKSMKAEVMVKIGVLKNVSARGKIATVVDYVNDLTASGEKIILFVHLKDVAAQLCKAFPGCATILGQDSAEVRDASVKRFQTEPDCKVIVCSTKAAGVGLTLTAASHVAFVELPWHGADCEQAEDRAHRIGQKNNVNCVYFLGRNTIDEKIYQIVQEKIKMTRAITGEKHEIDTSVFNDLLELLIQEKR